MTDTAVAPAPTVAAQDPKSLLESKTFWGIVVAFVMPFLAKHGIIVDPTGLAGDVSAVVGSLLAIYGRFTTKGPVTLPGLS